MGKVVSWKSCPKPYTGNQSCIAFDSLLCQLQDSENVVGGRIFPWQISCLVSKIVHSSSFIYNLHSILGCRCLRSRFAHSYTCSSLLFLAKDPHIFNNSSATNTSKRGRTFELEVQEQQPCTWIDRLKENPIQHALAGVKVAFSPDLGCVSWQ